MTQHSPTAWPTPWAINEPGTDIYCVSNFNYVCGTPKPNKPALEHIVRAVNAFDDLLAALRLATAEIAKRQHSDWWSQELQELLPKLNAAIAKAEGNHKPH